MGRKSKKWNMETSKTIGLLTCLVILITSAVALHPQHEEDTSDEEVNLYKDLLKIDLMNLLIDEDHRRNTYSNWNDVVKWRNELNIKVNQLMYAKEHNRYIEKLLDKYNELNEKFKHYIRTVELLKHEDEFNRLLNEKKYDEALLHYNFIKHNSTIIEKEIIDICKDLNFDNLLEFLSQISSVNDRAVIIKVMYNDCLLNNRFGIVTNCMLLKLYDKVRASKDDTESIVKLRNDLENHMVKLIKDATVKTYSDVTSVKMIDFPFFTISRNNVPWYNVIYWLEELNDGTDRCHNAIGALSSDSPKSPPIP